MLFDVIPENFFGPLAAPGKIVYWECICRLYAVTSRQLSFGVERDVLVDELQYYFDSPLAADIGEQEVGTGGPVGIDRQGRLDKSAGTGRPGTSDKPGALVGTGRPSTSDKPGGPVSYADADSAAGALSSRDKANLVLRRLESYGWIYIDVDYSYVQRVHFRDYAIQIIRTLLSVSDEKKVEYQGYIYTIYSLARARGNPGLRLTQIVENTESLITGLKSLNANIRQYIDNLTRHSTVAEILDALLNDYYTNVVDKAYHRLLTSDNVSKFRPEILERLEADSRSARYLHAAGQELAQLYEIPEAQAQDKALEMLHSVISAFRQLDEILDEINRKNTRYQRAAIGRARFLLTSSEDIRGQLKDILSAMNDRIQAEGMDYNQIAEMEETDRLIRIFSWDYLDMDSLYAPVEGKKEFVPQELSAAEVDLRSREARRLAVLARLERILTPEKIDAYVQEQLAGRDRMRASELPLGEGDTFIRMIYIRLYGQRKNMRYRLELLDRGERDGFRFRDFFMIAK